MNTLTNTTILVDTENGFAWAEKEGVAYSNLFQVCVTPEGSIMTDDCGWDTGICGDYNFSIYSDFDEAMAVAQEFFAIAEKQGIVVVR